MVVEQVKKMITDNKSQVIFYSYFYLKCWTCLNCNDLNKNLHKNYQKSVKIYGKISLNLS